MTRRLMTGLRVLALILWTAGWITLSIVASLLTWNRRLPLVMARRNWGPGILRIAGVRLEVAQLPDLDWTRPYVFTMNHQSMLDIPCAFVALPVDLRFLAKHSLAYVPFLGWFMAFTRMIFVNRGNRAHAMESLRRAGQRIREGACLLTYPEGTRSADGELRPFKRGAFVVALEAQVPVVPVAISGSSRVLPSGSLRISPGPVHLRIGTPIPTFGRSPDDRDLLAAEAHDAVAAMLETMPGKAEPAEVQPSSRASGPGVASPEMR